MVACPICNQAVKEVDINRHIDSDCRLYLDEPSPPPTQHSQGGGTAAGKASRLGGFFTPAAKRNGSFKAEPVTSSPVTSAPPGSLPPRATPTVLHEHTAGIKRERDEEEDGHTQTVESDVKVTTTPAPPAAPAPPTKKAKHAHAPLAERMRPQSLDEVAGQDLVGPQGILRNLIVSDRVPSMILWGGPGTGKTTIARLIAQTAGTRFVEINSTASGVGECKRLFGEARNEQALTGRRTIIFCDEIHRFSKSQQDVFLAPVEAGQVTLIGATTENPSFKVVSALLSRCRTFTLAKLTDENLVAILRRALFHELPELALTPIKQETSFDAVREEATKQPNPPRDSIHLLTENDFRLLRYLAAFSDGDARTALNLLELALDLCRQPGVDSEQIKQSLTQTLVYDRAGDQHYDTISAFHKSVRGGSADAALYYLARMLQSGEDPLYIARRMVVIASEDVGLADNSLLSLATATYTAAEKIGMPECRINLAHCAVALAQAPKSVRAYRGLNAAYAALAEPGVAGLPVPVHLRNAPTKLMKELGYGREYKYNPDYVDGRVAQEYLPEKLGERTFLASGNFGTKVDPDLHDSHEEEENNAANTDDDSNDPVVDDHSVTYDAEMEEGSMFLNPDGD